MEYRMLYLSASPCVIKQLKDYLFVIKLGPYESSLSSAGLYDLIPYFFKGLTVSDFFKSLYQDNQILRFSFCMLSFKMWKFSEILYAYEFLKNVIIFFIKLCNVLTTLESSLFIGDQVLSISWVVFTQIWSLPKHVLKFLIFYHM